MRRFIDQACNGASALVLLATAGTLTLAADPTKDVSFANAAKNFGTLAVSSGNNVTLRDTNDLSLIHI